MKHRSQSRFYVEWVFSSIIALIVCSAILLAGVGALMNDLQPTFFGCCFGALLGSVISLAQWLVLRKYIKVSASFIFTTTIAWSVFWMLNLGGSFASLADHHLKVVEGLWHGFIFGLILSIFQYISVRQFVQDMQKWVGYHALIWAACAETGDILRAVSAINAPIEFATAFPLAFIFSGSVVYSHVVRRNSLMRH